MEEEKYQKELFEFQEPKRSFAKLTDILPKADLEGRMTMTFTMEKAVFISIGIVMLMVVVYALGVESGKHRAGKAVSQPRPAPAVRAVPAQSRPAQPASAPAGFYPRAAIGQKSILNTSPVAGAFDVKITPAATGKTAVGAESLRPFSILAASFRNRATAQTTLTMLRNQGLNAFIMYSEPYYRVYVGMYADKASDQAAGDLVKVRRVFKDAFIKQR